MVVVSLMVGTVFSVFAFLIIFLMKALGLPLRPDLPILLRAAGLLLLTLGFSCLAWLFRYRSILETIKSTYISLRKTFLGIPPREISGRAEQLIILGPHRHVRHPMYFSIVVLLFGWGLLLNYTLLLLLAVLTFLWFNLVVIPFEERELRALFGAEYEAYAKSVPGFFPSLKPFRPKQ